MDFFCLDCKRHETVVDYIRSTYPRFPYSDDHIISFLTFLAKKYPIFARFCKERLILLPNIPLLTYEELLLCKKRCSIEWLSMKEMSPELYRIGINALPSHLGESIEALRNISPPSFGSKELLYHLETMSNAFPGEMKDDSRHITHCEVHARSVLSGAGGNSLLFQAMEKGICEMKPNGRMASPPGSYNSFYVALVNREDWGIAKDIFQLVFNSPRNCGGFHPIPNWMKDVRTRASIAY